ncbi:MAG: hypothetical protein KF861_13200 [Planctomycetaceae bacterium]|nr:hypothetical protein [Planctomycetaceae bacterium]
MKISNVNRMRLGFGRSGSAGNAWSDFQRGRHASVAIAIESHRQSQEGWSLRYVAAAFLKQSPDSQEDFDHHFHDLDYNPVKYGDISGLYQQHAASFDRRAATGVDPSHWRRGRWSVANVVNHQNARGASRNDAINDRHQENGK